MIKLSDYVMDFLADRGLKYIFMVSGGAAMHLNDSVGRCKRLNYICNHHEQASTIAAESYSRVTGELGVALVTSGPGGTNAITGVYGAWVDSIPILVISGQVKYETTVGSTGLPLRQLGDQELYIINLVQPITKYAVMVKDPRSIRYHLERALYFAKHDRPGPVWLDIPLNVQSAYIDEDSLFSYDPEYDHKNTSFMNIQKKVEHIIKLIRNTERPVLLAGSGIRLSGAFDIFHEVINKLGIPITTAWNSHDLMPYDHPLFAGRPSFIGDRAGNFVIQNSTLLLSIGCRLNIRQVTYDWKNFARAAHQIVVDIDPFELIKPTISPDMSIRCDAKRFLEEMKHSLDKNHIPPHSEWINWCKERVQKYYPVLPEYYEKEEPVNPYVFVEMISDELSEDEIIICGNGSACVIPFQALKIKIKQRMFTNSGCAAMGYDLPAAIGACFARNKQRIICFAGDGSIMLNLQELQTIFYHKLPIKIFVFNNNGYLSIRTTQDTFFKGNRVGCDSNSGISFPDFLKVAEAFGIKCERINCHTLIKERIGAILNSPEPYLCDVIMDPNQLMLPKLSSEVLPDGKVVSKPLEDMYPYLPRDEFASNMLIEIINP